MALLVIFLPAACRERVRPDILLITVDRLRADRLGIYGSRQNLTPNIDRFAEGALVFDRAYAVAPITGPSLSSAFTSHYPHETKITDNGLLIPTGVATLAELLRRGGYETAAVVSKPGTRLKLLRSARESRGLQRARGVFSV
jgi:arylsulfatase A-like enzyme